MPRRKPTNDHLDQTLPDCANSLSALEFQAVYLDQEWLRFMADFGRLHLAFKTAEDLSNEERDSCFQLIESTSRCDYEPSSFGWHPTRKRREMTEREMRYILVRSIRKSPVEPESNPLAFLSFMLTFDSSPTVEVLYIYEIHLTASARGRGLGEHLMRMVEAVAKRTGMQKVMLTCFLSNARAQAFYARRGYERDASSPDDRVVRGRVVKADYVILSKPVSACTSVLTREAQKPG